MNDSTVATLQNKFLTLILLTSARSSLNSIGVGIKYWPLANQYLDCISFPIVFCHKKSQGAKTHKIGFYYCTDKKRKNAIIRFWLVVCFTTSKCQTLKSEFLAATFSPRRTWHVRASHKQYTAFIATCVMLLCIPNVQYHTLTNYNVIIRCILATAAE